METTEFSCPHCNTSLIKSNSDYFCPKCNKHFIKIAYCDKCNSELEKLAACGSVSYWCNKCNELKSKKSIMFAVKEK